MYFIGKNELLIHDPWTQLRQQREGNMFSDAIFLANSAYYNRITSPRGLSRILTGDNTSRYNISGRQGHVFTAMLEHIYKRKIQLPSWSRQLPRKQLDWRLWQQTLAPLLQNDSNRKLKYSLGRRDKEVLQYWKWHFSDSCNRLFARHGQVFTECEMSNGESRKKTGNYVAIKGICETLQDDIKEIAVNKD